ncbi:hypothetical protein MRB53_008373 [Persea americana]|uniref:Uncharacterized protein n=1 Tax=Persea americana TaxID=3435 RepID=A0ACC2MMJ9_PERAE|nr:hypothetical protein MRB53_008373 [Persea americana]
MVFDRDSATGRFARSSVDATTLNIDADGQGNAHMSGIFEIRDEDVMQEVRMSSNGGGGSYNGSKNRKRKVVMTEFMAGLEKSSAVICASIDGVTKKMGDPIERLSTLVYRELKKIPDLLDYDVKIAHEWLNANIDKASAFLDIDDKNTWILRRMQRIRNYLAS